MKGELFFPKWIDEKVLQRYWIDRCTKYEVNGEEIVSAKFNIPFDRYPDVFKTTKLLLQFNNLKLDNLSEATKSAIHHLLATGFWGADPIHFVEILSRAHDFPTPLNLNKSY